MRTEIEVPRWTAEEFERIVLDCRPRIAVFDCDGTLWGGDAGYGFMAWSLEQGLVSRSTSDWIDTRHRAYRAGQVSEEDICGEMVQIYAGLRDQELRAAAAQYFAEFIEKHIFPEMTALVAALHKQGAELWAVSSTNRWVIEEGVKRFGIPAERVLAAEVSVTNGLITSELTDVPTGPGKAVSLRRVGLAEPDAVFGNSIHDLAMLEMARCAFPVNPSPSLLEEAAGRGWGYFRPAAAEGQDAKVGGE
ncbi:MAG TPA: haloacid dehalogenase-like hydrolase [Terracidiphilus sp.]|nr:haloacid dehalogenase-like hydrolase [Terracidiphilus sp.]